MSLYEQAFRDAFSTHADEAPPLPPLLEPAGPAEPERRRPGPRARELVALVAAIALVAGLGWAAVRGPNRVPGPGQTLVATPAPTQATSAQVTTSSLPPSSSPSAVPSASTTPSSSVPPPAAVTFCQVPLPQQWSAKLQAGALPADPRQMTEPSESWPSGYPLTDGVDRYLYVALFRQTNHPIGYDGMVSEVRGGQRTDLYPINANSGYPRWATYVGDDLVMALDFTSGSGQLVRYRRATGTFETILSKGSNFDNPVVLSDNTIVWLQPIGSQNDYSRAGIASYDPATGEVTQGPEVNAQRLVAWQGMVVTVNTEQTQVYARTMEAYDSNLNPVTLPEPLEQLRGWVSDAVADDSTLVWVTDGKIHWFRDGMAAPVTRGTGFTISLGLTSVSDGLVGAGTLVGTTEGEAVFDLDSGSWTEVSAFPWPRGGRLALRGTAWGGQLGNWSAKISDLGPLPRCQR